MSLASQISDGLTQLATAVKGRALATEGGLETIAVPAATTGTVTLDLDAGSLFKITPTGNITLAVSNLSATSTKAACITIVVIQGGTPRTVGLMTGGVWLGTAPTQTASKTCVITAVTVDGGTTWLCSGVVQA